MMMGDGDGWWMAMWACMTLFALAAIGGAAWIVGSLIAGAGGDGAHEVLRGRLAAGDIDLDEFRRREAALGAGNKGPLPQGLLIAAAVIAVAVIVTAMMIAMSANGWGWGMHGRGRNTSQSPPVRGGAAATVRIQDFAFDPGNLEVPVGANVTWINDDSAPHDATARNGDWNTGRLSQGGRDTLTFESAGVYDYYCSIHPSMKARLVVR